MNKFLQKALEEAELGIKENHGGPFGAVIVKEEEIIASAHNTVPLTNDPTAHAEINAIRQATKFLGRFDLSDCEIYTTCEPCPMCLSAIYWAKIPKIIYACTRKDAEKIGFDDNYIYKVIKGENLPNKVELIQEARNECLPLMKRWFQKDNKINY